ncbi:MAG: hypothetical protein M0R74_18390 [Dehalococcoidia bacterium]|nr:hypothetical protein [Dehalococcoidia bacterium]
MKTLVFICECKMTEAHAKKFIRNGRKVGMGDNQVGTIHGKPMLITGAGLADENPDLAEIAERFRFKEVPHA